MKRVRLWYWILPAMVALGVAGSVWQQAARAQTPTGPVYVLTHIDVTPNFTSQAAEAMSRYAIDSRGDPDAIRIEVLQQDERGNHLVMFEVWQSREAYNAHSAHPHSRSFREALQPMLGSPFDVRLHSLVQ